MSTYIMSDIHGDLPSFEKMLEIISFNEKEDFLIINGDVLDRGEHGIKLLFTVKEMVESGCALTLKGNHELFAQMYMEETLSERKWMQYSGDYTIKELNSLDEKKKNEAYGFIKQLPYYVEREHPKYGKTVITHTGIAEEYLVTKEDGSIDVIASIEKAREKDEYQLLISADIHYWPSDKRKNLDKYIICGHVPTYQLGPEFKGQIFETREYMDIDAGAGHRSFGGKLACYCFENGKKYYI